MGGLNWQLHTLTCSTGYTSCDRLAGGHAPFLARAGSSRYCIACADTMPLACCFVCGCAEGLFDIMAPSFGHVDLHMERAKAGVRRR